MCDPTVVGFSVLYISLRMFAVTQSSCNCPHPQLFPHVVDPNPQTCGVVEENPAQKEDGKLMESALLLLDGGSNGVCLGLNSRLEGAIIYIYI